MKIDKQQLIQLRMQGKTTSECAKVFGCNPDTVRKMCRKLESEGLLPTTVTAKAEDYVAEKHLQTDQVDPEQTTEQKRKTVDERLAEEEAEEKAKKEQAEAQNATDKYPIAPIDRKTFWAMRRDELRGAICEYACCGLRIDPEWVQEYNDLIEEE